MPDSSVGWLGGIEEINFVWLNVGDAAGEANVEKVVEGFDVRGGEAMEFANVGFFGGVGAMEGGYGLAYVHVAIFGSAGGCCCSAT